MDTLDPTLLKRRLHKSLTSTRREAFSNFETDLADTKDTSALYSIDTELIAAMMTKANKIAGWTFEKHSVDTIRIRLPDWLANSPVRMMRNSSYILRVPESAIPDNLIRWRMPTTVIIKFPLENRKDDNIRLAVEYDASWTLEALEGQLSNDYLKNSFRIIKASTGGYLSNPHFIESRSIAQGVNYTNECCIGSYRAALCLFQSNSSSGFIIPIQDIIIGLFGSANFDSLYGQIVTQERFATLESMYVGISEYLINVHKLTDEESTKDLHELLWPEGYGEDCEDDETPVERCEEVESVASMKSTVVSILARINPSWVVKTY